MSTELDYASDVRHAVLGGEVASRWVGGINPPTRWAWGFTLVGAAALLLKFGVWGLLAAVALVTAVLWATISLGDQRPYAELLVHQLRTKLRHRTGEHIYVAQADPDYGNPDVDPGWSRPVPLGAVDRLDLRGTGLDDMFILWHHNPGEANLFTIVLSVQGLSEGLRSDAMWAQNFTAFSDSVLNSCARRTSHVRTLQMVSRSVASDLTPHELWVERRVAALDPVMAEKLMKPIVSYGELIEGSRPYAEDHRCYLVVGIGESNGLMKQASKLAKSKGASVEGGVAQVIRDEVANIQRALVNAGYGRVDVLGEQRTCAVMRALMNPSFALDRHEGVRWDNCWPSYIGTADAVVSRPTGEDATAWHTRVGVVPPGKVAPVPLSPNWLAPLLTGVPPDEGDPVDGVAPCPTIRTISVRMDLVPADVARAVARKHRTSDAAQAADAAAKGKITDGTADVMAEASDRRGSDLRQGSGYHGVIWSLGIAVTGRDSDDLDRACARVAAAADDAAITDIHWQDDDHDIAQFWTLPLGRGLAATRYTR